MFRIALNVIFVMYLQVKRIITRNFIGDRGFGNKAFLPCRKRVFPSDLIWESGPS
jgi:hypothetical protein